eukprot:971488_1
MTTTLTFLSLIVLYISRSFCTMFMNFTEGTTKMPYKTAGMAVGYDASTDTILLLGGQPHTGQHAPPITPFTMFKNNRFNLSQSDHAYVLAVYHIFGYRKFYSQINNELWMISGHGQSFITLNTETYDITLPYKTIPINVNIGACLTSIDDYLIIVGGGFLNKTGSWFLQSLQIYHINGGEWLSDPPSLTKPRAALACAVVDHRLYAIGGRFAYDENELYSGISDTIEVLEISNMNMLKEWRAFNDQLNPPIDGITATVYDSDIYVVGGYLWTEELHDLHIIDTIDERCTVITNALKYPRWMASSIIVRDTLYVFGGLRFNLSSGDNGYYVDAYEYILLPSLNPTTDPTSNPITNRPSSQTTNLVVLETLHSEDVTDAYAMDDNVLIIVVSSGIVCICVTLLCIFGAFHCGKHKAMQIDNEHEVERIVIAKVEKAKVNEDIMDSEEDDVAGVVSDSVSSVDCESIKKEDEFIVRSDTEMVQTEDKRTHGEENENTDENVLKLEGIEYDVNEDEAKNVQRWLTSIGCSKYYNDFIQNGFDSVDMIKEINSVNDLNDIGVRLKAHQLKLLNHINKLKQRKKK